MEGRKAEGRKEGKEGREGRAVGGGREGEGGRGGGGKLLPTTALDVGCGTARFGGMVIVGLYSALCRHYMLRE